MAINDREQLAKKDGESASIGAPEPARPDLNVVPTAIDVRTSSGLAITNAQQTLDNKFGSAPAVVDVAAAETFESLSFSRTQQIQQMDGETGEELHERLRPSATAGFNAVRHPTQIDTPSWYTFDASKELGIKNAVAIITSTCKHELPYQVFVGIRGADWEQYRLLSPGVEGHRYRLRDLGRELTEQEKNAIYDKM